MKPQVTSSLKTMNFSILILLQLIPCLSFQYLIILTIVIKMTMQLLQLLLAMFFLALMMFLSGMTWQHPIPMEEKLDNTSSPIVNGSVNISTARVAIIGGGISGASTAYFLRQLVGPAVNITVFEAENDVGGRIQSTEINGQMIELGAQMAVRQNRYFMNLAKFLKLAVANATDPKTNDLHAPWFGVFDGDSMLMKSGSSHLTTSTKVLWRYGLDFVKARSFVRDTIKTVLNLYTQQFLGNMFETVSEFTGSVKLTRYMKTHFAQSILELLGYKATTNIEDVKFVDEIAAGASRSVFQQQPDEIHTLAGILSLAPLQDVDNDAVVIKGGNQQLPKAMLRYSKANVATAHRVQSLHNEKSKIRVALKNRAVDEIPAFDVVVIAAPLETAHIDLSDIDEVDENKMPKRTFQKGVTTFVEGIIDPRMSLEMYCWAHDDADIFV